MVPEDNHDTSYDVEVDKSELAYALHRMFPDQYPAVPKPAWLQMSDHSENNAQITEAVPAPAVAKPKPVYKKLRHTPQISIFQHPRT